MITADAVEDKLLAKFVEVESVDKLSGYAASLRSAWATATTDGTISEQFDDIDEWFESYGTSVAFDAITDLRSIDAEFDEMYIALGNQEAFDNSVEDYVMSIAPEITSKLR